MVAARYDFTIEQGTTWEWDLQFPSTVSLTSATSRMDIKQSLTDSTAILSLNSTSTSGYMTISNNTISVSLPATVTTAFTFSTALYDLEIVFPGNIVNRYLQGIVTLSKEVTTHG